MSAAERADAVIVGARPAGAAAAIALARAGRRVVALERSHFPSETLSTHLMFAGAVAEIARLGALEGVSALGAPRLPEALMGGAGITVRGGYTPVDGIDHALCVRRTGLDDALVQTARDAGAEVRERARVTDLIWERGRVAGVRWEQPDGGEREIRSRLVIGADGRRSTVARLVGAAQPYRWNPNGRACFYAYLDDAQPQWRSIAAQWREGAELGTAFPCDGGQLLVLLMPPMARAHAFRQSLDAEWDSTVAAIPALRDRVEGCRRLTKIRSALDTTSYFRRSSGPGWALPGDAGHFKDPVTAQGIRDALRFGRMLGEAAAPALEEPRDLDRVLLHWERRRERECLETYTWTNALGRGEPMTALETELYRSAEREPEIAQQVLDVFSRTRRPSQVLTVRRGVAVAHRALRRPEADRPAVMRAARGQLRDLLADRLQRTRARLLPLPRLPSRAVAS